MKMQSPVFVSSFVVALVTIASQPTWSFTIVPSQSSPPLPNNITRNYVPSDGQPAGSITTRIKPYQGLPVPGTSSPFFNVLNSTYSGLGWNFVPASQSLAGNFFIGNYYACVPGAGYACGERVEVPAAIQNPYQTVGGALSLFYFPRGGDPMINSDLHWIQMVTVTESNATKNKTEIRIDNTSIVPSTLPPFYPNTSQFTDRGSGSLLLRFLDAPQREDNPLTPEDDRTNTWDWTGQLFLARENAPTGSTRNIEIFNGIEWGWSSSFTPKTSISSGGSGGGGFFFPRGLTQNDPIFPTEIGFSGGKGPAIVSKNFFGAPSGRWFDPPTTFGFEFQALDDTLFTDILDFPILEDMQFTVEVDGSILGEFGPGDTVDFVALFGEGISSFKILDIDVPNSSSEVLFPIQLAFNEGFGDFSVTPIGDPPRRSTSEPPLLWGLFLLIGFGVSLFGGKRQEEAGEAGEATSLM